MNHTTHFPQGIGLNQADCDRCDQIAAYFNKVTGETLCRECHDGTPKVDKPAPKFVPNKDGSVSVLL